MYNRILLATDGTIASANAESHAIDLAATHDADLYVLYVVDESVYTAYSGDEYVNEAEGPEHGLTEHGQETLDRVHAVANDNGVEFVETLRHGGPVKTIIEYGDDQDVDLIVLGTKHRSAEYRALLGSVTDRVLRLTARPTLVIKTEADSRE
ncbi:universal stress protein [Halococcus hamelinensis]|uniref:UspA domain-containing protein n=1 Tax=Halococcus hamelinensis 100A6 TaxID=1132509 RepID=M0MCF2_9EURY|nr:universal stress protein [Halococcus hamelinensis]EMA42065.1 UspA domain-containing protein [Halococcus hamelinensis 100A6]